MQSEVLDVIPLWALLVLDVALLWLAMEGGYLAGKWRRARYPDEQEQPVGAMVASILGLLALVLAFTFNMAASRFEARRQTILEEANAIGTTYLRAWMLPEPQRTHVRRLLREYVDLRVQGFEEIPLEEAIARSEGLHEQLWAQAIAAAEHNAGSIMTGLFVQSLNEVIDLHSQRVQVGLRSRVPLVIWGVLFGLAVVSMAAVGYQAAHSMKRRSPVMPALFLTFAGVLFLIADLDRVQEGLVRISQQALIDVRKTMPPE